MSNHTKGPWKLRTAANGDCGISAEGTGVFVEAFAEIRHSGENAREEALANARLISAAPDLLAALKHSIIEPSEWVEEARAAIAKAEGRS
jgi:hypothetical protein